jgi:hypothetical protein
LRLWKALASRHHASGFCTFNPANRLKSRSSV